MGIRSGPPGPIPTPPQRPKPRKRKIHWVEQTILVAVTFRDNGRRWPTPPQLSFGRLSVPRIACYFNMRMQMAMLYGSIVPKKARKE